MLIERASVETVEQLADSMARALEDPVRLHYQPLVDIATGRWCGAEALARWFTEDFGQVPPAIFIPLAEEVGLVSELGQDVLRQVMGQITIWQAAGFDRPVAINVSRLQLADPGFVDDTVGVLSAVGVRPDRVSLEITESALMANPELARRLLTELQVEGIETVIDDFGTGYSSIARLRDRPTSGIKIDKSSIATLTTDSTSTAVVAAVVALAHAFGLIVTAEGVESRAELRILGELGCDRAQGFLFARPAPPEPFVRTLAQPAVV